jgi:hypothetical protein
MDSVIYNLQRGDCRITREASSSFGLLFCDKLRNMYGIIFQVMEN